MDNLEVIEISNQLNFPIRALVNSQFNQTYAIAMVDFGSLDTFKDIPAGAAHFLEHKLFAKPGYDSSQRFAQFGADANAFTSYTKTAFLFKTIGHVSENLTTLLDLISHPYFTTQNVAREQEIIAQEIQMYADMPDWILEQATLNNLFPDDPIAQDIAGSISSIKQITPATLETIYQKYYTPANLRLYLAGNVDVQQVHAKIAQLAQQSSSLQQLIQRPSNSRVRMHPALKPVNAQQIIHFKTQRPHLMLGLRIDTTKFNLTTMILLQNQIDLLLELIFGDMSQFHQNLSNDGLLDDSFGYNVIVERQYAFILLSGETQHPQTLANRIEEYLFRGGFRQELTPDNMAIIRRDSIGSYLFAQDYLENLATEAAELDFYGVEINQVPQLLSQVQVQDLLSLAQKVLQPSNLTKTILYPE